MNFDRMRFVCGGARGAGEGREAWLAVTIPERPGASAVLPRAWQLRDFHRVKLPAQRTQRRADFQPRVQIRVAADADPLVSRLAQRIE